MKNSPTVPARHTFARESLTVELFHETLPLLMAHWEEIAHFKDIPLKPDQQAYQTLSTHGNLRIYTVREGVGGTLIGYAVFFLRRNMHYSTSLQAVQDILYLDPASRGRLVGYRFIKWCDDQLRAEGVQLVMHHVKVKPELDFGPMLERIGYEPVDRIFARRLDKET
jgi:GNAT superfamily N-acetyltransferase